MRHRKCEGIELCLLHSEPKWSQCDHYHPPLLVAMSLLHVVHDSEAGSLSHTYEYIYGAFLVAQMVKNLPAMWETQIRSLGQEYPLEKGMATDSSILNWRITWTEEPGGQMAMSSWRAGHDWATNTHTHYIYKCMNVYIYALCICLSHIYDCIYDYIFL